MASVMAPDVLAATRASRAPMGLVGHSSTSAPAIMAATAGLRPWGSTAPFIPRASVYISPSKPRLSRSTPRIMFFDSEAGASEGSSAGTTRWPTIMLDAPASMLRRKGMRSVSASVSRLCVTRDTVLCESVEVSPWPGKSFGVACTPASSRPSVYATVATATRSGSSPKER